jgi:acyl dehydratase
MSQFPDLDAVRRAVGADLGVTGWHLVTQQHVDMFAEAASAREWIHTDEQRASQESPFGRTVAHGYLTLSLATPFVTELVGVQVPVLGINYGAGRVRFPAPLPVGSRVRARGRLVAAKPAGPDLQTTVELIYEAEDGARPPCTAEIISRLRPASRPSRAG